MAEIKTIIFDLGGVLIDWNPDYVYNTIFDNPADKKWFYENICTHDWNEEQDAGRSLAEAKETLIQLSGIFNLIETMQAVDTSTVEPMSHAQSVTQRLREDEVTETDQRELYQSIAPQVEAGLYLVPQVIE